MKQLTKMLQKRISVKIFVMYFVICSVKSDFLKVKNDNEKLDSNLNLSAAVHFIIKSVNASDVQVIGCSSYFRKDFNELSWHWRRNVSSTLLNVERKYIKRRKVPKNVFILIFIDQHFMSFLKTFMDNSAVYIRKHKMVVITKSEDCNNKG